MKDLHGKDFGYPLMELAEAFVYRTAFPVEWERHASWEIHHVLSGGVVYEFDGIGGIELHGGTFLAIPPRTRHRTMNGSAAPSTRLAMRWAPQKPGKRRGQNPLSLSRREIAGIFSALSLQGLRARAMSNTLLRAAKGLFNEIVRTDDRRPQGLAAAALRHRCNDVLLNLALSARAPEPISKDEDVVMAMKRHIDAHLDGKMRMPELVQISGYGATQLCKLFQDRLGLTPSGYIVRARVEKAKRMLEAGGRSVTDIALACGFPSASYFATVFRKYCGLPPREWR